MQQVFISYSRKDMDFVRKLAGDLEKAGYEVWWDITDLHGGDDWIQVIPAAIKASLFFIVVLSPHSVVSEWVEKEYTQALSLHKKIIPIMLAACDVPFALNTINYTNFSVGEYTENFNILLAALGFAGEPPAVKSFEKTWRSRSVSARHLAIPSIIGLILLLAVTLLPRANPVVQPTGTTTPPPSTTPTATQEPATLTFTASPSLTALPTFTPTETSTPKPIFTSTPLQPAFTILIYCINSPYAYAINVRSGPGTNYAPLGEPLLVGKCLAFRGQNEAGTWLLVAPDQADPSVQQYEGGWIARELLGLGSIGSIDLPVVTLTPTPLPSATPTLTSTFTPTLTPTLTETPFPTDIAPSTATPAS